MERVTQSLNLNPAGDLLDSFPERVKHLSRIRCTCLMSSTILIVESVTHSGCLLILRDARVHRLTKAKSQCQNPSKWIKSHLANDVLECDLKKMESFDM